MGIATAAFDEHPAPAAIRSRVRIPAPARRARPSRRLARSRTRARVLAAHSRVGRSRVRSRARRGSAAGRVVFGFRVDAEELLHRLAARAASRRFTTSHASPPCGSASARRARRSSSASHSSSGASWTSVARRDRVARLPTTSSRLRAICERDRSWRQRSGRGTTLPRRSRSSPPARTRADEETRQLTETTGRPRDS